MEFYEIGSSPCNEECAQTLDPNFTEKNRLECRVYIDQLTREFGEPPGEARYSVKASEHDFGTYREVVIRFNPDNEEETAYADKVQDGLTMWDTLAKEQLLKGK